MEAIAIRLEAVASRLEAIPHRLEAIARRLEAIAHRSLVTIREQRRTPHSRPTPRLPQKAFNIWNVAQIISGDTPWLSVS